MTHALSIISLCGFEDVTVEAVDGKGSTWRLFIGNDDDGDGFTLPTYAAVSDDGRVKYPNWSRFGQFSAEHFRMYVELGFPDAPARHWADGFDRHSPWQPDELLRFHAAQRVAA